MVNFIVPLLLAAVATRTADRGASAARILGVFPHHGYSHHMVFLPYLRTLADRGHDVHVISNFESSHPKITDISVAGSMPMANNNVTFPAPKSWTFGFHGMWQDMWSLYELAKTTEAMFGVPAVRRLLDDRTVAFDLVIAEHFNSELPMGFAAKYRVPFVLLSSCSILPWTKSTVGQPHETAYRPSTFSGMSERMNTIERLANTFTTFVSATLFRIMNRSWSQQILKKHFGLDVPLGEFASNVSLVLVNTHWTISGVSPTVPTVMEIGGMHLQSVKKLPDVCIHI